jgi:hypothetical protein
MGGLKLFKKIFLVFLFSILLQGFIGFDSIKASQKDIIEITSIDSRTNQIELLWSTTQGNNYSYQVINDNEIIYSGKESSYIHTNLEEDNAYEYIIKVLNRKSEVLDEIKVRTTTLAINSFEEQYNNENNPNLLKNIILNSVIKKNSIKLDWDDIPGVVNYEVYKNGILVDTVKKSEYKDKKVSGFMEYTYEIKAEGKLSEKRKDNLRVLAKMNGVTLTPEQEEEIFVQKYSIIRLISPISKQFYNDPSLSNKILYNDMDFKPNLLASTTSTSKLWAIRYTTFIPMKYAENPYDSVDNIKYFGGDNRSWNSVGSTFRTRTDVNVCFCSAGQSVSMSKNIGTTVGYNSKYEKVDSDTEDGNGIVYDVSELSSSRIKFKVDHASNNPLVPSPDIDYEYDGTFNSTEKFTISGWHDQAPNHEMYIKLPGSSSYTKIIQDPLQSFNHLFPWYPNKSFSYSK